jgi:hypothetical protein
VRLHVVLTTLAVAAPALVIVEEAVVRQHAYLVAILPLVRMELPAFPDVIVLPVSLQELQSWLGAHEASLTIFPSRSRNG